MSLAAGAALALHLAVIFTAHAPSGAATLAANAGAMTVRYLVPAATERVADTAARSETVNAVLAAPEPAPPLAPPAPKVLPDRPAMVASTEPAPSVPAPGAAKADATKTVPPSPQAQPALPPAPDYWVGARLDPGPQPIGEIEPEYPDSAHLQEGTVVLRILISDAGHVDNVAVVKSEPKGLFEEAATEAFAKAAFTPGRADGVPVKSQITVEVHFIPINRGARISGRTY